MDDLDLYHKVMQAGPEGMWEKAIGLLEKRLAQEDDKGADTLERLGQLYRKIGNLSAAAESYKRLHRMQPTDVMAAYLHAILTGAPSEALDASYRPAPFVRRADFLLPVEREALFQVALQHQAEFAPLPVYDYAHEGDEPTPNYNLERRHQLGLLNHADVSSLLTPKVLTILPDALPALHVRSYPIGDINTQLTLMHHGHFGKPHRDDVDESNVVVFLYYFHTHPKMFTGGDLLLYDLDSEHSMLHPGQFTRIR
ncbi:MAG: hypothetical protein OEU26_36805, partial [Candidatus Tectomicrobia bacterium]|nr:hypothetical protein [Candidatus Tectomicrobia bacterium]